MSRRLRYAPADWRANETRVRHTDGETGTFVGNSPGGFGRGWLGVLILFDGEAVPLDVDPADCEVLS